MPPAPLVVEMVPFGEPETGRWCSTCLLPSAVVLTVAMVSGMAIIGWAEVYACVDCGETRLS